MTCGAVVDGEVQRHGQAQAGAARWTGCSAASRRAAPAAARPAPRRRCPTPLSARAAMMPATAVPWSSGSSRMAVDEVLRQRHLAGEVRMVGGRRGCRPRRRARCGRWRSRAVRPGARPARPAAAGTAGRRGRAGCETRSSAGPSRRADRAPGPAPRSSGGRPSSGTFSTKQSTPSSGSGQSVTRVSPCSRASSAATRRRAPCAAPSP